MAFFNGKKITRESSDSQKSPTQADIEKMIKMYNETPDRKFNVHFPIYCDRCGFKLGVPRILDDGTVYEWQLDFGTLTFRNNLFFYGGKEKTTGSDLNVRN
ncbi:MAG: hypothetical protein NT145_05260 [Elusimicrobia bacterium]|nr:hypothetical protein [Elusimicrobiota bacterium]